MEVPNEANDFSTFGEKRGEIVRIVAIAVRNGGKYDCGRTSSMTVCGGALSLVSSCQVVRPCVESGKFGKGQVPVHRADAWTTGQEGCHEDCHRGSKNNMHNCSALSANKEL